MQRVAATDVTLSVEQVLDRLPLSSAAFHARPASTLVGQILLSIDDQQLLAPAVSQTIVGIERTGQHWIELDGGVKLSVQKPVEAFGLADGVACAAWTLGPRISEAVSSAFGRQDYLYGLLLDEIASLMLFRLGETVLSRLESVVMHRAVHIGSAFAPGDGVFSLSDQATVLELAGADRVGITCKGAGLISPLKSASALAPVGRSIEPPGCRWSCTDCASSGNCRLQYGRAVGRRQPNSHGTLH